MKESVDVCYHVTAPQHHSIANFARIADIALITACLPEFVQVITVLAIQMVHGRTCTIPTVLFACRRVALIAACLPEFVHVTSIMVVVISEPPMMSFESFE